MAAFSFFRSWTAARARLCPFIAASSRFCESLGLGLEIAKRGLQPLRLAFGVFSELAFFSLALGGGEALFVQIGLESGPLAGELFIALFLESLHLTFVVRLGLLEPCNERGFFLSALDFYLRQLCLGLFQRRVRLLETGVRGVQVFRCLAIPELQFVDSLALFSRRSAIARCNA